MKFRTLGLCLITFLLAHTQPSIANDDSNQRKAQNFIVLPEVAMSAFAGILAHSGSELKSLGWTAKVSDRLWSMSIESYGEKEEVRVSINGYSWGTEQSSNVVSYVGTGTMGSVPVLIHGRIDWPKEKDKSGASSMTFEQITKVGKNSLWSWVVGTEIVGCGVAGGVSANVFAGGLTSGLSLPFAASIFITGASGGASACVSISTAVKETIDTDDPPSPPKAPPAPIVEPKKPLPEEIIVVAESNGILSGRFPLGRDGHHLSLKGEMSWSDGYAKGVVYNEKTK